MSASGCNNLTCWKRPALDAQERRRSSIDDRVGGQCQPGGGFTPRQALRKMPASGDAGAPNRCSSHLFHESPRNLLLARAARAGPAVIHAPYPKSRFDNKDPVGREHRRVSSESGLPTIPLWNVVEEVPKGKARRSGQEFALPRYAPRGDQTRTSLAITRPAPATFEQLYDLREKLGAGSYGEVYWAIEKATGRKVAVKTVSLRAEQCNPHRVQLEVAMLKNLSGNRGVAKCYTTFTEGDNMHIVMELCSGGDLRDYIQENGPLTEAQTATVAFQVLLLLRELHEARIVHGDVKPANFVITNKLSYELFKGRVPFLTRGWLKGVDFGCSQHTGKGRIHHKIGTPSHWAPEVFGQDYHIESDIWSTGVMLYELLTGKHPFCTPAQQQRLCERDILQALIFKEPDFKSGPMANVSPECIDFLKGLLCKNVKKRLTVTEALEHTWMRNQLRLCKNTEKKVLDGVLRQPQWALPAMKPAMV